jgi:hypothetical protein
VYRAYRTCARRTVRVVVELTQAQADLFRANWMYATSSRGRFDLAAEVQLVVDERATWFVPPQDDELFRVMLINPARFNERTLPHEPRIGKRSRGALNSCSPAYSAVRPSESDD